MSCKLLPTDFDGLRTLNTPAKNPPYGGFFVSSGAQSTPSQPSNPAQSAFQRIQNACIAFSAIPTPKTGHFAPESLQRDFGRFGRIFGAIRFRPVSVSCPTLRGVPDQISRLDGGKVGPLAPVFRPRLALHMSHFCLTSVPLLSHFCPSFVPDLSHFCTGSVPLSASRCSSTPEQCRH